jgi:hypothetical protein
MPPFSIPRLSKVYPDLNFLNFESGNPGASVSKKVFFSVCVSLGILHLLSDAAGLRVAAAGANNAEGALFCSVENLIYCFDLARSKI